MPFFFSSQVNFANLLNIIIYYVNFQRLSRMLFIRHEGTSLIVLNKVIFICQGDISHGGFVWDISKKKIFFFLIPYTYHYFNSFHVHSFYKIIYLHNKVLPNHDNKYYKSSIQYIALYIYWTSSTHLSKLNHWKTPFLFVCLILFSSIKTSKSTTNLKKFIP